MLIKRELCAAVKEFSKGKVILEGFNNTILVLIPKSKAPDYLSQFRPMSLCNVLY